MLVVVNPMWKAHLMMMMIVIIIIVIIIIDVRDFFGNVQLSAILGTAHLLQKVSKLRGVAETQSTLPSRTTDNWREWSNNSFI